MSRSVLWLLVLALTACSNSDATDEAHGESGAPDVGAAEFLDGYEAVLTPLGGVNKLAISESDRLVALAQNTQPMILVFDHEGNRIAEFGRSGEGPGELRSVATFGFDRDVIWVSDIIRQRVSLFTHGGAFEDDFALPPSLVSETDTIRQYYLIDRLGDYEWVALAFLTDSLGLSRRLSLGFDIQTGQVTRRFANTSGSQANIKIGEALITNPFPTVGFAGFRDGVSAVVGFAAPDRIEVSFGDERGTARMTDVVVDPEPISAAQAERTLARLRRVPGADGASLRNIVPDYRPPILEVVQGDGGAVAITTREAAGRRVHIVTRTGDTELYVVWPRDLAVGLTARHVWLLRTDTLDVPSLYRLSR